MVRLCIVFFVLSGIALIRQMLLLRYISKSPSSPPFPTLSVSPLSNKANHTLEQRNTSSDEVFHGSLRRKPIWEWSFHDKKNATTNSKGRLLIAQYSSLSADRTYARLMELTAPINKAYAKRWGHDLVILQGTTFILPKDGSCEPEENRSMFNKIDLLRVALSMGKHYDQLLILDSDAMIYDFERDVTELITEEEMLVAHRVREKEGPRTWNINNGVSLWNLHHPLTRMTLTRWNQSSWEGLSGSKVHGDQMYLQRVLKRGKMEPHIHAMPVEFKYEKGTVIKHFVRQNKWWNNTGMEERLEGIQESIREVYRRFSTDCERLERKVYTR
jgi:hypothetical protein